MDLTSIAVMMMSARSQATSSSIAASLIKNNLDSQKQLADLISSSSGQIEGAATLAAHLGQNLDVSV